VQCHVASDLEAVFIEPDVLKTLGLDALALLESRQATGETKEIEFLYV